VPSIDDNEDLEFTHDAFNILHFTEEETYNIYKIVAAVMSMGELVGRWLQNSKIISNKT
jgi:myosin heavy subunit